MARPHIEPLDESWVPWRKLDLPGFPPGIEYRTLSFDDETGAISAVAKFAAGYSQPPGFSRSSMEIVVMDGHLKVGDRRCGFGFYLYVPAGVSLPPIEAPEGARVLLFYNDSEPSFVESDAHADAVAPDAQPTIVDSLSDLVWSETHLFPATEKGCLVKIVRWDEETHALSFFYTMVPGFWQDNVSYHDCMEEAYHIYGTSWIMQFGYLGTGGYFYRPPYIGHGPFACEHGCIAFGRTDGELYNHFNWNPFATPEENHQRALERMKKRRPNMFAWEYKRRGEMWMP
ncbi:MAG: hypothetical protein C4334_00980 [Pyrinomonas sp.]|uniref:DUF4437 domain-containing protein n=1 Tax=Pyrinomonas sp. TaxID=2080306 RepID=UPI003320D474